jgi:IS5 family transposase
MGRSAISCADQAYWSEVHRIAANERSLRYRVSRRPASGRRLTEHQRRLNRLRSATRARGEHAFRVVKQLWGYSKVRYRGLAKNTTRLYTMCALANLYLVRRRLLPT